MSLGLFAAIARFMQVPKKVIGADVPPVWAPGYTRHERVTYYPLEVEGEQYAKLMIVAFPREQALRFRLGILYPPMVCRLDFTDEYHPNTANGVLSGRVPPHVDGPHYHSWPLNERFFRGETKPIELRDAIPYLESGRSFDAILRWFCADTKIESLPVNHRIELPVSGQMELRL